MQIKLKKLSAGCADNNQTVLLIHGWAMNSVVWLPLIEAMPDYCFYGLDLPGHGDHANMNLGYDLADWSAAAVAALDQSGIARCHLIGWSLGGMLATKVALQIAERCQSLTLIASNPRFVSSDNWLHAMPAVYLQRFIQNLQQDIKQVVREFMELQMRGAQHGKSALEKLLQLVEQGGLASEIGLQQGLLVLQMADTRADLRTVSCPVCAVLGQHDTLVPAKVADDLLRLVSDMQVDIIAKSGHVPFVSHTAETADLLNRFLVRL